MIKGIIFLTLYILLASCANKDCNTETDPSTPLNIAIRSLINDDSSLATKLLNSGSNPNQQNECGASLLHISIITGDKELALRLIQMGGESNLPNWQNETPVFMAANWSRNEVLEQLLLNKGNPNHVVSTVGLYSTPLLIATTNKNTVGVKLLLKYGANPLIKSSEGKLPLDIAESKGYHEIIKLLTKAQP